MRNKKTVAFILIVLAVSFTVITVLNFVLGRKEQFATDSVKVKSVDSQILADGTVASLNEANLHFQAGGKLISLAAKEGDSVYQGQSIASLDTYALQRQLTAALNNYKITRDSFDQTGQNTTNGVAVGQQRYSLEVANKANLSGQNEVDIISDMVKRLVDQSQAGLDNSVINVELANYALQLSSLTAPFGGMIVHEDVNQPGVNITPVTSFLIVDPSALLFRANVAEQDIDYITVGSSAVVTLNGDHKKYIGTVSKIYPEKIALPGGQNIYRVEISVNDFKGVHYAQAGSVQIKSLASDNTKLVPRWTILNGSEIWVKDANGAVLKTVTVGKTHGDFIEVTDGLSDTDQIIINPQTIVQYKYTIL